jgi:hypothetical protein
MDFGGKRNPDGQGFAVFARAQFHAQAETRDNAANSGIQRVIGDIVSGSDEN